MLRDLDIRAESGAALRGLVKSFTGVPIADRLTLELRPKSNREPILCGIEITADGP